MPWPETSRTRPNSDCVFVHCFLVQRLEPDPQYKPKDGVIIHLYIFTRLNILVIEGSKREILSVNFGTRNQARALTYLILKERVGSGTCFCQQRKQGWFFLIAYMQSKRESNFLLPLLNQIFMSCWFLNHFLSPSPEPFTPFYPNSLLAPLFHSTSFSLCISHAPSYPLHFSVSSPQEVNSNPSVRVD